MLINLPQTASKANDRRWLEFPQVKNETLGFPPKMKLEGSVTFQLQFLTSIRDTCCLFNANAFFFFYTIGNLF